MRRVAEKGLAPSIVLGGGDTCEQMMADAYMNIRGAQPGAQTGLAVDLALNRANEHPLAKRPQW